jgi:hypothetical protein
MVGPSIDWYQLKIKNRKHILHLSLADDVQVNMLQIHRVNLILNYDYILVFPCQEVIFDHEWLFNIWYMNAHDREVLVRIFINP